MMLVKKTIIDQIEITRDGTIQIRCALMVLEDGKEIGATQWHRMSIPPGADVDAQLALVDDHLSARGVGPSSDRLVKYPAVDRARVSQLKAVRDIVHTPEVIEQYETAKKARADLEASLLAKPKSR